MTNGTAKQQLQMVRDATAKYLPATTELQLGGQSVKVQDLLTSLDGALATFAAADAAQAALKQTQSDRTQKLAAARALVGQLKAYLVVTWGKGNPQLGSFGFNGKARKPLTSEQKTLMKAKAALTRKARGTMSAKQKLGITVQGTPGLVLVAADGTPMPGVLKGPSAPALTPATTQLPQPTIPAPSGK